MLSDIDNSYPQVGVSTYVQQRCKVEFPCLSGSKKPAISSFERRELSFYSILSWK